MTKISTGKTRKNSKIETHKKKVQQGNVSDVIVEKKTCNNSDTNVSVFTKTTGPKVVVQSENVDILESSNNQNICKHRFIKSVCLITIITIILITFFLSLKTYHVVNELYQSLN